MSKTPPSQSSQESPDILLATLAQQLNISPQEMTSMLEAIERGESREEYFGFTPDVLRSIENIGLAYYRGQRFDEAKDVFQLMVTVSGGTDGPAFRGLGACAQAQEHYADAVGHYRRALAQNKQDEHSAVFLGECLCILGEREEGLAVLQAALDRASSTPAAQGHPLRRAQAIIAAGGVPEGPKSHRKTAGGQAHEGAKSQADVADTTDITDALAQQTAETILHCLTTETEAHDPEVRRLLADPKSREQLTFLAESVRDNRMTIRQIADFSQAQIDAGYALASQLLEQGEALKAMEAAAWMLWVDGRDTRFHRLIGLCLQHIKLYALADYFYSLVAIWREGGADAATLMYHGEVKVMLDDNEEGLRLLRRGIHDAAIDPAFKDIAQRGRILLRQLEQRQG